MDEDADEHTCTATLHHLIITLHVGGNEYDLGPKAHKRSFEELHRIWSSSLFFRVPENHSLRLDVFADQTRYCWPKCFLLIRAYPDEEPSRISENQPFIE